MTISTRRFCGSRTLSPVGTSSWLSPLPMTVIAWAGTPSDESVLDRVGTTQRQRHVVALRTGRVSMAGRRDAGAALGLEGVGRLLDRRQRLLRQVRAVQSKNTMKDGGATTGGGGGGG